MNTSKLILVGIVGWIVLISFITFACTIFYWPGVLAVAIATYLVGNYWLFGEYENAPFEEALE